MPVSESGAINLDKATNNLNNDGVAAESSPNNIIDAVSDIQKYHVFEKEQDDDINKNFFTLRQVIEFIKIGFKSGFIESLVFVIILPFFQTIYPSYKHFFLHQQFTNLEKWVLYTISYSSLVIMTFWLTSLFRLYDGAITKKAILSLLSGRSIAFILKGVVVFYGFIYLYNVAIKSPESTYVFIDYTKFIFDFILPTDYTFTTDDLYQYYYLYIIPALVKTAKETILTMLIFAVIPFISIVGKGVYVTFKRKQSEVQYEEY